MCIGPGSGRYGSRRGWAGYVLRGLRVLEEGGYVYRSWK